jgi:hypothetical protein
VTARALFGSIPEHQRNGVTQQIVGRDPNDARLRLLIQRIRHVCAKNYHLRIFLVAEVSRLAVAVGLREREARPA